MSSSDPFYVRQAPQREQSNPALQRRPSSRLPVKTSTSSRAPELESRHISQLRKRTPAVALSRSRTNEPRLPERVQASSSQQLEPRGSSRTIDSTNPSLLLPPRTSSASEQRHLRPPPSVGTPSLVSGSSASTYDGPQSRGLRRKASTIEQYKSLQNMRSQAPPTDNVTTRSHYRTQADEDSVFGISLPPTSSVKAYDSPFHEWSFECESWHAAKNTSPSVPPYAQSATPSTRFTDSPFSHVPTPSSASSYSPGLALRIRPTERQKQPDAIVERRSATAVSKLPRLEDVDHSEPRGLMLSSSKRTLKPAQSPYAPSATEIPAVARHQMPRSTAGERRSDVDHPKPNCKIITQNPPELAHLNTSPPIRQQDGIMPPRRPSRDNTPSMPDMGPAPIVHSDLPHTYTTYHKRTPSQEMTPSAASPSFRSRFGFSTKSSPRQPSPRVDSAISPPPSARLFTRSTTPDAATPTRRLQRRDSPVVGSTPSPSKYSRFGLFSRKPRNEGSKATLERPKRPPVKGPAAGTGHEGYDRFNIRARSGSVTSNDGYQSTGTESSVTSRSRGDNTRKSSVASGSERDDLDDFLRQRLRPIVIRGSGTFASSMTPSTETVGRSALQSSSSSSFDTRKGESGHPHSEQPRAAHTPRSVDNRAFTRLLRADGSMRGPAMATTGRCTEPGIANFAKSTAQDNSANKIPHGKLDEPYDGREGLWLRPGQAESRSKPIRKWNFFQRAHSSRRPDNARLGIAGAMIDPTSMPTMSSRNVTYCAMPGSVERIDLHEVEQILDDHDTSSESSVMGSHPTPKIVPYEGRHTSLLPSPPDLDYENDSDFRDTPTSPQTLDRQQFPESPEVLKAQAALALQMPHVVDIPRSPSATSPRHQSHHPHPKLDDPFVLRTPELGPDVFAGVHIANNDDSPKQPRLSPVGRIPMVVSKRDRDRKLPDNSFSRPFVRTQPNPSVKPPGALYSSIRELASPIESASQPASSTSTRSDGVSVEPQSAINTKQSSMSTDHTSIDVRRESVVMGGRSRKASKASTSSSSRSSWAGSFILPPPQQDDPWLEYNDLLDDMLPVKTPTSAGSSLGAPFQYSRTGPDSHSPSFSTPLLQTSQPPLAGLPLPPRSITVPPVLSIPQQIARFMQPSLSPLTPHTLSDLVDSYSERSTSIEDFSDRASTLRPSRRNIAPLERLSVGSVTSSRHSRISGHSRSASLPVASQRSSQATSTLDAGLHRDAHLLETVDESAVERECLLNLRFGALMTSKWLSFGRVLFSPAHNEMRLSDEPRVLVIDGLGSDWSHYVALSYPSATVYNLGAFPQSGSPPLPASGQTPPANLRQIPHSTLGASFPFPKGFFTAVVFRFPVASTEQAYLACICECKRVLRPGGHLEVAVLDLDLMNMGNRARRLVRGLKTRMQQHDQSVSLRNMSDVLVRLIGRRGFEDVQRCIVGIPAAGRIRRSEDAVSDSSGRSHRSGGPHEASVIPTKNRTFSTLLDDAHNNSTDTTKRSDEGITKMVAKVGRWWYSTCYETALLPTDRSIWDDHALLRECGKQGTSFRLLICCAQKPTQARRRTVSV